MEKIEFNLKDRIDFFNRYDNYDEIILDYNKEVINYEQKRFEEKKYYVLNFLKDKKVVKIIKFLIYKPHFLSDNKNTFKINATIPSNLDFNLNENSSKEKIENLYNFITDSHHYISYYNYKMECSDEIKVNLNNIKYDYENNKFNILNYKNKGKLLKNYITCNNPYDYSSFFFEEYLENFK